MADLDFDAFEVEGEYPDDGGARRRGRFARLVNGAGAATSVALILGLGIWGWRLAVRDVTGVPVIRAIEGPARTAPDEPGGELAQHTGLAVNAVAAEGEAAPPADALRLAPGPVGLAAEDVPMGELQAAAAKARGAPVSGRVEPQSTIPVARTLPEPLPDEAPDPILDAPVVEDIDAAVALAADMPEPAAEPLKVLPASVPGVARSPRPMPRPGTVASAYADTPEAEAVMLASFRDVDPATLQAGDRLVQLGAFDSEAAARSEWDRLAVTFGAVMTGKGRVIQQAESAGKTFYRLRASGFADQADARRFCAALVDKELHCIPVQVR